MKHEKLRLKKGDLVEVIAGRDKGKRGKVMRVDRKHERLLIEGVNFVKRHTRPSQQVRQGGIIEKEAPVPVSKVAFVDPSTDKPSRLGVRLEADGTKVRVCRPSGASADG